MLNENKKILKSVCQSRSHWHDKIPLEKVNFNSVSSAKQNVKKDPTRSPKNMQDVNFEDKRYKHFTFVKEQSLENR